VTSPAANPSRARLRPEAALACILALAAVLRFGALDWGLRHEPHVDERYFVENTGWMLAHRDLDHRFDEYPGLFFYLTAPVLAFFGPPRFGADGYLAARAVVAAFGVCSVGLTCLLGMRLRGPFVGLAAALLVAVSPVAVQTAHMVRPDVVLEAFVLLAFLGFARVGRRASGDWTAGALVGAATAVKFTGVLLAPAYVAVRLLRPGRRAAGLVMAGAASIAVFALCSPYSVAEIGRAVAGATTQVSYHYGERPRGAQSLAGMAWTYGLVLRKALGPLALALAVAGAVLGRREWRRFLPLWVFPLTVVGVFSTAEVHHDRFLLPALGVSAILCAEGARRLGRARMVAAVAMAVTPFLAAVQYVRDIHAPGTRDRALDAVLAHLPDGGTVVTTLPDIGLDRSRYVVNGVAGIDPGRARLLARHADLVIARPGIDDALLRGLRRLETIEPASVASGPALALAALPGARHTELALSGARLTVSDAAEKAAALRDGDPATAWVTSGSHGDEWIEVAFAQPTVVSMVQLRVPGRGRLYGRNLHVSVADARGPFRRIGVVSAKPAPQPGEPPYMPEQVLLFDPVTASRLRIEQVAQAGKAWGVAELKLWTPFDRPPEPR
jgi:hypothetical protein